MAKRGAKLPAGKGRKKPTLDRDAYARARAQGKSLSESARIAGSKARSTSGLCTVAAKLEREDGMYPRIVLEREKVIRGMDDAWTKAQARMEQLLDHPKWLARYKSADFFAKLRGGYAPKKVEHSGTVESTPVGSLSDLTAEERAALRAILKRREAKTK